MQCDSVSSRRPVSAALIAAGLGFTCAPLHAATITVTTSGDAGAGATCTFRQAIVSVNTATVAGTGCVNSGGAFGTADTVNFQAALASPITVLSEVVATRSMQISGPGAALLTLSGGGATRMLRFRPAAAGMTLGISALTFASGNGGGGGAFYIQPSGATNVTIADSVFTGNTAAFSGGALYTRNLGAAGTLLIQRSVFSGNTAAGRGGALYLSSSQAGTITIQDSTISGNSVANQGGGIFQGTGTLIVERTTIANNSAANDGGGIERPNIGGITTIRNSTITGNTVTGAVVAGRGGGGLRLNGNTSTIDNTTIANNSAPNNEGGNIELQNAGTLTMRSTIVSGGTDSSGARDIFVQSGVTTFTVSNSLVQNPGNSGITVAGANLIGVNPLLGPLASNGGPTQTMALLAGSPAINTGSNPNALTTDQRGAGFPRVVGLAADIGAFEVQAAAAIAGGAASIPALDDRALLALAALAGFGGALALRRRKTLH